MGRTPAIVGPTGEARRIAASAEACRARLVLDGIIRIAPGVGVRNRGKGTLRRCPLPETDRIQGDAEDVAFVVTPGAIIVVLSGERIDRFFAKQHDVGKAVRQVAELQGPAVHDLRGEDWLRAGGVDDVVDTLEGAVQSRPIRRPRIKSKRVTTPV